MPVDDSKTPSQDVQQMLSSLGRGLGTVSVYGTEHPSVALIVEKTFLELQLALKTRPSVSIGAFNGVLTVDGNPVVAHDVATRTLEKRLVSMKITHLVLNRGLLKEEFKQLLGALCAPSDEKMKETIASGSLQHVELGDVKYVAMRDGERLTGSGKGGSRSDDTPTSVQVGQIMAFLKGKPSSATASEEVKDLLSDPEKLGQIILEAATVRQSATSLAGSENMADIVIGCLRRTYEGLKKEPAFSNAKGKASLTKAMMLLEKTVLDKIHRALGSQNKDVDRRILSAIKEMQEERQAEVLTAHYCEQRLKTEKAEEKIVEYIRKNGQEKALEQFVNANIPLKDWQRLMVQSGTGTGGQSLGSSLGGGVDMSALAMVLEKIEDLIQIDQNDPRQIETTIQAAKNGFDTYTDHIEARIQKLEGQIQLDDQGDISTVENHAGNMTREDLMQEVSQLTLSLLQPLTVVNASVEAALQQGASAETQQILLEVAHESGQRIQSLAKRIITLVGYPTLENAK